MATWKSGGLGTRNALLAKPYLRKMSLVGAQRVDWREQCSE